ncbi:MAG: hypothetical protein JKY86_15470 [Gammaproteobacteria bacterium]|nr:hypothetical protein [Gammaproteobacteria bacterium]
MTDYPSNSTAAQYQDMDGNLVTLMQLIKLEPEWAHSRITVQLQEIERYRSALQEISEQHIETHEDAHIMSDIAITALEDMQDD